jgi:hypothetical protein
VKTGSRDPNEPRRSLRISPKRPAISSPENRKAKNQRFSAACIGVRRVSEEQFQRFQAGGERGPGAGDRTGGDIISIDQNKIVVRNPWQGEKTIVINDQTAFSKEGQTITSKDLKVGDRIFASGKEMQGQFVATQVRTGQKGTRPERGGQPGQPPQ